MTAAATPTPTPVVIEVIDPPSGQERDDPADPWYGYPVGLGPVPERLLDDPDERPF